MTQDPGQLICNLSRSLLAFFLSVAPLAAIQIIWTPKSVVFPIDWTGQPSDNGVNSTPAPVEPQGAGNYSDSGCLTMDNRRRIMSRVKKNFWSNESGAVAVYVGIGMLVFLGFAALALDIAHMVSVKRELVKAAEAGALSGARGLWAEDLSTATTRDPDCGTATNMARTTTTKNRADGANLTTDEVTVEVGRWDYATKLFTPGNTSDANGVRVTTSRANVQMYFAQVLGQGPKNMSASAVAIMDYVGEVGQGCLPIAINRNYINPETPPFFINFTPDPYDNAGWFSDPPDPASASTIKHYINDESCPPLYKGQLINLNNGNDTSCLQDLKAKLDANGGNWVVCLPVVDVDQFNQDTPITDFCSFHITQVINTGNPKGVWGKVLCVSEFQNALPGGGKAGALAPPKLVQ